MAASLCLAVSSPSSFSLKTNTISTTVPASYYPGSFQDLVQAASRTWSRPPGPVVPRLTLLLFSVMVRCQLWALTCFLSFFILSSVSIPLFVTVYLPSLPLSSPLSLSPLFRCR